MSTHVTAMPAEPEHASASPRGRGRFAAALVGATLFLIFYGGQVTTTLSGDSVPSWPASFFLPADKHQFWELGHRWVAGTVGLLTVALAVVVFGTDRRRGVRWLAGSSVAAVIVQALIGGLRVRLGLEHSNVVPIIHTMLGQTFFALVVALAAVLRPLWLSGIPATAALATSVVRGRARALLVMVWCQILLGAILRHATQDKTALGTIAHILGAVATVIFGARLVASVVIGLPADSVLRRPALWLAGALGVQLLLGLGAFLVTHTATGYVNPQDVLSLLPTLHLVLGSTILGLGVLILLRAFRHHRPR